MLCIFQVSEEKALAVKSYPGQITNNLKVAAYVHFRIVAHNIVDNISRIQWNLDLAKCQGTAEICSLYRGFVISKTSA